MSLYNISKSVKSQDDHWDRCFSAPFEDIPKAPGNGLILRQVHFDQYNKDWAYMHGAVDWAESQLKMDNFVKSKILPEMFECDIGNDRILLELYNGFQKLKNILLCVFQIF